MNTEIEVTGNGVYYGFRIVWTNEYHTYQYNSGMYFSSSEDAHDEALNYLAN